MPLSASTSRKLDAPGPGPVPEPQRKQPQDEVLLERRRVLKEVDLVLQQSGADSTGIGSAGHGPTMKALLNQCTKTSLAPEMAHQGEHRLLPTSGMSRGEHLVRSRLASTGAGDSASDSRYGLRLDAFLRHLDKDRLGELKERFIAMGNALTSEELADLLAGFTGPADQGNAELKEMFLRLHAQLVADEADSAGDSESGGPDVGVVAVPVEAAFLTEAKETEGPEGVVTWTMFAKLLLERGVVDVVGGFNIVTVLGHLDLEKIAPLQDEFKQYRNALNLEEFVVVMKRQFRHSFELARLLDLHGEERRLLAQLVNLFEMIDIGGKNSLSWEEFTSFLVDQGMTEDVHREFNIIRFSRSTSRDDVAHTSYVEKAVYLKNYDKVAFFEQGCRCLKLWTPDLVPYREIRDFTQTPLCVEYIDRYMYVVVACSDLTLSFYDSDNNLKLVRRVNTEKTAQLVMCWSEVGQVLFTADHEGRIFATDVNAVKFGAGFGRSYEAGQGDPWRDFLAPMSRSEPSMRHSDGDDNRLRREATSLGSGRMTGPGSLKVPGGSIVLMLLELPVLAQMASCGVDRNVMIWDVFTGVWKRTLRGHEMGVRCMAFATSTKVLVTGGFDYKLMVWNPYWGKSIHTLHGHAAPIIGIEVLGSSAGQVVSADSAGSLKTWDLATYQCLQTIVVEDVLNLRAFVSIPSHKRVLAADRKFVAYDYQNNGMADQTDEAPIIKAIYNPRLKVFISGCMSHLRIWDAVTGAIKCVIPHKDSEITDFCVDDRGRKVFIADHNGDVSVHNSTTGCFIKKLIGHKKEVSGVIYCTGDRNIITVSWDKSVVVHDESQEAPKIWRQAVNVHHDDISCVAFSHHLGLVATGSIDCVISLREYERLRTVSSLLGHKTGITALAFVEPYAALASADFGGNVAIWSVPAPSGKQHRFVNHVLTRFINMMSLEASASVNCLNPVYEAAGPTFHLYTGDEDGDVRAWDLSQLLTVAGLEPCAPKADWDGWKKDIVEIPASTTAAIARKAVAPETPELKIHVEAQVVRQLCSWRAHSDSVRTLKVYSSPQFVLTAGYDHMVKIWTLEGQLLTVLRAYGQIPWHFPVGPDMDGLDEDTLDEVLERVQEVDRKYDLAKAAMGGARGGAAALTDG
mmetsp:Transcript_59487/g.128674  ORF Transcript_59487/g.128674 Transcript_59487/m.128674 type:complete len:1136 (+) Transcript_59487:181-3588(+)